MEKLNELARLIMIDTSSGEEVTARIGASKLGVGIGLASGDKEIELWLSQENAMKLAAVIEHAIGKFRENRY